MGRSYRKLVRHWPLGVVIGLFVATGCSLTRSKTVWREPVYATANLTAAGDWPLAAAEASYAVARQAEDIGSPDCVDRYFAAAVSAWQQIEAQLSVGGQPSFRADELYRSSLAKLLITAQRFGRWQPQQCQLTLANSNPLALPASYQGFTWGSKEFQDLQPCGDYESPKLSQAFRSRGLGIPLVVVRQTNSPQPFTQREQTFAATAVLRADASGSGALLEFYDPLRVTTVEVSGRQVALARDLDRPLCVRSTQRGSAVARQFSEARIGGCQRRSVHDRALPARQDSRRISFTAC